MKKFLLIFAIFLLVLAVIVIFRAIPKEKKELKLAEVKIGNQVFTVEVANSPASRARGLSGRQGLKDSEGMLFVFEEPVVPSFWMKGMRFPIDIIWIRSDKVVGFEKNAPPATSINSGQTKIYSPNEPVDRVLEVNAGTVSKFGIRIDQPAEIIK